MLANYSLGSARNSCTRASSAVPHAHPRHCTHYRLSVKHQPHCTGINKRVPWQTSQLNTGRTGVIARADVGKVHGLGAGNALSPVILNNRHDAEIWGLAIPAFLSLMLDPLMTAVNTAVVGRLGTQALAAVSMGSLWVMFCGFIFSFLLFLTTPKIAAAVARKDMKQVSKTTSETLWVGFSIGVLVTVLLQVGAAPLITAINPPEAQVGVMALEYMRTRSLGITATLMGYAASGCYRGFRDTSTPLRASIIAAVTNLVLNLFVIFGVGWGVQGSGLATAIASWTSCGVMITLLMNKGRLFKEDLLKPPPWSSVAPLLQSGMLLSGRTFLSMGLVMYATTLCVRASSVAASSFEVLRQLWILSIQFFECLNVSCQALCAAYLGSGDRNTAMEVLMRISFLGTSIGTAIGIILFTFQAPFISLFTTDPRVAAEVSLALPLLCVFFPLDAMSSIMDGALFAGQQSDFVSYVSIWGAFAQVAMLGYITANGLISALLVWSVFKLLTVIRLVCSGWRVWKSDASPFLAKAPAA